MRNLGDGIPLSLAGSLLVAHPNMLDPNFRRAVLFISAHEPDEGALGVILNRPLDKQVADLVAETPPENLADVPVFIGGPVGRNLSRGSRLRSRRRPSCFARRSRS